jgi:hypothetical protein
MMCNFKSDILLAIWFIQLSAGVHASHSAVTCDIGKAKVFVGNSIWVSGHPDAVATFSRDVAEVKKNMQFVPGINNSLLMIVAGIPAGFLWSFFFLVMIGKKVPPLY